MLTNVGAAGGAAAAAPAAGGAAPAAGGEEEKKEEEKKEEEKEESDEDVRIFSAPNEVLTPSRRWALVSSTNCNVSLCSYWQLFARAMVLQPRPKAWSTPSPSGRYALDCGLLQLAAVA